MATAELQLHYYLRDGKHSMDAVVRNRCETEALAFVFQTARTLGIELQIETVAFGEGGLREYWRCTANDEKRLNTLLQVVMTVATVVGAFAAGVSAGIGIAALPDSETKAEEKELRRLSIEKLRRELGTSEPLVPSCLSSVPPLPPPGRSHIPAPPPLDSGKEVEVGGGHVQILRLPSAPPAVTGYTSLMSPPNVSTDLISQAADAISEEHKVAVRRSNFYRALTDYEDVTAVAFSTAGGPQLPPTERSVRRDEFSRFVLRTSELPTKVVEDAVIEIIAPVLKPGKYQWRGIYDGETISFVMADAGYKAAVTSKQIAFQNGIAILCVLEISQKLDEIGEVLVTGYKVTTVLETLSEFGSTETAQGRRYRGEKELAVRTGTQAKLFEQPDGE